MNRARIRLHPFDAASRGLVEGQRAPIFNDRGAFAALVEVSERVRPGVVATSKGHWPKLVGSPSNVNATVAERERTWAAAPCTTTTACR